MRHQLYFHQQLYFVVYNLPYYYLLPPAINDTNIPFTEYPASVSSVKNLKLFVNPLPVTKTSLLGNVVAPNKEVPNTEPDAPNKDELLKFNTENENS